MSKRIANTKATDTSHFRGHLKIRKWIQRNLERQEKEARLRTAGRLDLEGRIVVKVQDLHAKARKQIARFTKSLRTQARGR